MWTLLLLAATVRSFAHMPLGISDRNTTHPALRKQRPLAKTANNFSELLTNRTDTESYRAVPAYDLLVELTLLIKHPDFNITESIMKSGDNRSNLAPAELNIEVNRH